MKGEAYFKHIKPRKLPALLQRLLTELDSGQYQVPKAFGVLSRFRSEELNLKHAGKPMQLNLPERALIQDFYARHPEGKLEPVPLQSFKPPLAKQYAARQLQLKQELRSQGANLPQAAAAAQAQTEQEFAPRIKALHRSGQLSSAQLSLIQQEEEKQLRTALQSAAERRASLLPGR